MGEHRGGPNINKFISSASSTYGDDRTHGYKGDGFLQVHHILCVSCFADGNIDVSDLNYIHSCMGVTEWNVNEPPNLIGLPTKSAYVDPQAPGDWGGYPCHQVEHNPSHTDGVKKWLNDNIWSPLEQDPPDCTVVGKTLAQMLARGSTHWRRWLLKRGKEEGGTKTCWKQRNDPGMEDSWFIPFSMCVGTPKERKPFPEFDLMTQSVKSLVKGLLKMK